jgi:hypothetical protein
MPTCYAGAAPCSTSTAGSDPPRSGKDHNAALRQLADRLVGILHGCLETGTIDDVQAAWPAIATHHFSLTAWGLSHLP